MNTPCLILYNFKQSFVLQFAPHKRSQFQNLKKYLKTSLSMMRQLATGKSSGNHGEFLIYNIPAITMEGIFDYHRSSSKLVEIEKSVVSAVFPYLFCSIFVNQAFHFIVRTFFF